jgi:hypothetical protein
MQQVRNGVRRVARIVWTLHLTLREGFDNVMMETLKHRWAQGLGFQGPKY